MTYISCTAINIWIFAFGNFSLNLKQGQTLK